MPSGSSLTDISFHCHVVKRMILGLQDLQYNTAVEHQLLFYDSFP